jgi:hypothetical protein
MMRRAMLVGALLSSALSAQAQTSNGITAQSVWARATPPGATTGAVYLTLRNRSATADQLVSASTPVAGVAGVHSERMTHGVMEMRPVNALDLAAGAAVTLKPGGLHIMLMALKQPLRRGTHFPLTLRFAHAAPLTVDVEVAKIGASAPAIGGMKDMEH